MATPAEHAAELDAMKVQAEKIATETRSLITRTEELLAALETAANTTPEVDTATANLKAQLEVVDALVPDAP